MNWLAYSRILELHLAHHYGHVCFNSSFSLALYVNHTATPNNTSVRDPSPKSEDIYQPKKTAIFQKVKRVNLVDLKAVQARLKERETELKSKTQKMRNWQEVIEVL